VAGKEGVSDPFSRVRRGVGTGYATPWPYAFPREQQLVAAGLPPPPGPEVTMRAVPVNRGVTAAALLLTAAATSSCASSFPAAAPLAAHECEFAVFNRSPAALEVRMLVRGTTMVPIGGLNPGEMLTQRVPCSMERVVVRGTGIAQVGVLAGSVHDHAELIPGERVRLALSWP
jgi:hypothetical protein